MYLQIISNVWRNTSRGGEMDRKEPRWTDNGRREGRREWILPIVTHKGKDTGVFILFFQLSYKTEMTAEVKKLLTKGGGKILSWQAKKLQMRLRVLLEVAWVIGRIAKSRDQLCSLFASHSILPVQWLCHTRETFKTFKVTWVTA